MSVIVKGMEMPKNCMSCPFPAVGVDAYYCHCPTQDGKEYDFKDAETIPDTCPLVEVPTPHGRLIDADGFKQDHSMGNECAECEQKQKGTLKSCEYDRIYSKMDFCQWLDDAPTVIEGSET